MEKDKRRRIADFLSRGHKVRITTYKTIPARWNSAGQMNKWMGKIVTIEDINKFIGTFSIIEDPGWTWKIADIEEIVEPIPPWSILSEDLFQI